MKNELGAFLGALRRPAKIKACGMITVSICMDTMAWFCDGVFWWLIREWLWQDFWWLKVFCDKKVLGSWNRHFGLWNRSNNNNEPQSYFELVIRLSSSLFLDAREKIRLASVTLSLFATKIIVTKRPLVTRIILTKRPLWRDGNKGGCDAWHSIHTNGHSI